MEFTEPLEAAVVAVAQRAEFAIPNRTSLPSMLPPAWRSLAWWSTPEPAERGAALLGHHADGEEPDEDDGHRRQDRPALARVPDHGAERVAERGGDHQDREELEEVRERRRVLERMGRVDVEEPAAVRAELLDRDLGRGGADGQDLLAEGRLRHLGLALVVQDRLAVLVGLRHVVLGRLDDRDLRVLAEGLDHALGDQDEREHERQRQQDVERRPGEVHPEVPDGLGRAAGEAPDERGERGHAGGGRDEVLDGQAQHLGEIAHRRLAAVPLPVGVGGEADGGVEGRVGRHRAEALRVQRQPALEALEQVHDQQAREVEEQHRERVGLPAHLPVGPDARDPVDEALEPAQDALRGPGAPLVDPRHVEPERLGQRQEDDEVEGELQDAVAGHENTSGFRSATTR